MTPTEPSSTRRPPLWGYALALVLVTGTFLFANRALVGGDAFPRWDASKFYAPAFMLVADFAREGQFLLWNPWMNGGRPDGADPQVGAFSPWTVAIGLLTGGKLSGYITYWLATWWLAVLGVVALARHLRAPAWGAVVAAAAFFSSGFFTGHGQHMTFMYSQAFLPWIIWRLDVALKEKSPIAAAQTGAIWGISALAGYPGMTILNFGFAGLWTLGRLFLPRDRPMAGFKPRLTRTILLWSLIVAVGVAVLSPAYVSFFAEGKGYSDRVDALTRDRAVKSNALHPGALISFASPHLSEIKAANRGLWKYSDPSMVSIYVAASAFVLAFAALLMTPRNPWLWWLFGTGLFFLLAAMGQALPLRGWLYDYLPPMRYFRHSAIFRGQYIFAVVVLALYGSRELQRRLSSRTAWTKVAGLGIAFAVGSWLVLGRLLQLEEITRPLQLDFAARLAACLWLAPVSAAVVACFAPWQKVRRAAPWILALTVLVDAWQAIALSSNVMEVRNRIQRAIWADVDAEHVQSLDITRKGLQRTPRSRFGDTVSNRSQAAKEAVFQSIDPFSNRYMVFWSGSDLLKSWVTGTDRIWFSTDAEPIAMTWDVYRSFIAIGTKNGAPPLLIHPEETAPVTVAEEERPAMLRRLSKTMALLPTAERVPTAVTRHHPNELTFKVDSPSNGWLWVTDRYSSGWKATVNGEPRSIVKANFLFRAIEVPEGISEVRFTYELSFFPHLLILSWGTLLLVLTGSFIALLPRKRQRNV